MASFPIPPLIEKTNGLNFHFQPAEYIRYTFVSSLFHNIAVDFCFHTPWRLGQKPLRRNILFGNSSKILSHLCPTKLHPTHLLICCQTSCHFEERAQFVRDQSDFLLCCVSDYVLMKQSHPSCMINCAEDCISLSNCTYLVNEIRAIQSIFSRDPKILFLVNCVLLLLVIEFIST